MIEVCEIIKYNVIEYQDEVLVLLNSSNYRYMDWLKRLYKSYLGAFPVPIIIQIYHSQITTGIFFRVYTCFNNSIHFEMK